MIAFEELTHIDLLTEKRICTINRETGSEELIFDSESLKIQPKGAEPNRAKTLDILVESDSQKFQVKEWIQRIKTK